MNWDDVRGHDGVVELFRRAAGRGRLSHAYAFVGPQGIGKATFARTLAACLICSRHRDEDVAACGECHDCRQWGAGSHPDVLVVGCPPGKKFIPIDAIAGSDERRGREGLCHDLSLRPMSARRRIAIVDDAHLLNEASANALLKTLEEPPRDSMLILIANDFDALLPTIRSRCQPIRFAALSEPDVTELLVAHGIAEDRESAESAAALSEGSLAVAAQLLEPRFRALRDAVHTDLGAETFDPRALAERVNGVIDEIGGDRQRQRTAAGWIVRFAIEYHRAALRSHTADPVALDQLGERLDRCAAAAEQLDRNSPHGLVLEALFDALARSTAAVRA